MGNGSPLIPSASGGQGNWVDSSQAWHFTPGPGCVSRLFYYTSRARSTREAGASRARLEQRLFFQTVGRRTTQGTGVCNYMHNGCTRLYALGPRGRLWLPSRIDRYVPARDPEACHPAGGGITGLAPSSDSGCSFLSRGHDVRAPLLTEDAASFSLPGRYADLPCQPGIGRYDLCEPGNTAGHAAAS
jgi:hypothetical protein